LRPRTRCASSGLGHEGDCLKVVESGRLPAVGYIRMMQWFAIHRSNFRSATILLVAALVAGCQSAGERLIAQAARSDTCAAKPLRSFVGRKADYPTREALEQRVANKSRLRWLAPGDEILADLNTDRANVVLDENGTIKNIGCF